MNTGKDVIECCGFSRRTETNVGLEAYESMITQHVGKWDGSNMEKDF